MIKEKELKELIESLTDGEFIDVLDALLSIEFGLTASEWIERQYKKGNNIKEVRKVLENYRNNKLYENY